MKHSAEAAKSTGERVYGLAFTLPGPRLLMLEFILLTTASIVFVGINYTLAAIILAFADSLAVKGLRKPRRLLGLTVFYLAFMLAETFAAGRPGLASPILLGALLAYGMGRQEWFVARLMAGVAASLWLNSLEAFIAGALLSLFAPLLTALRAGDPVLGLALARTWLDDYELLENYARTYGEQRQVISLVTAYSWGKDCIALTVPQLHYGPLRRMAGAQLPYMLISAGLTPLHPPLSHEANPCSWQDVEKSMALIVHEARRLCSWLKTAQAVTAMSSFVNGYRVRVLPAPIPLAIVDRPGMGIDDPHVKGRGVAVVDAHNEELSSHQPGLNVELSSLEPVACIGISAGYSEAKVNGHARGLCDRRLKALAFNCNGSKRLLVVIPSNNAARGLRARIELLLGGLADTVVATLDDHRCVALKPGTPVEAAKGSAIVDAAVRAALRALKSLQPVSAASALVETSICIWGEVYMRVRRLEKAWWTAYLHVVAVFTPILVSVLGRLVGF